MNGNKTNQNETRLLQIIRQTADPGKALEIAMEVILGFLERPESSASPSLGFPAAQGGTTE